MWCIIIIPILIPVKQQLLLIMFRIIIMACTQNFTYNNKYLNYCGILYYVDYYVKIPINVYSDTAMVTCTAVIHYAILKSYCIVAYLI